MTTDDPDRPSRAERLALAVQLLSYVGPVGISLWLVSGCVMSEHSGWDIAEAAMAGIAFLSSTGALVNLVDALRRTDGKADGDDEYDVRRAAAVIRMWNYLANEAFMGFILLDFLDGPTHHRLSLADLVAVALMVAINFGPRNRRRRNQVLKLLGAKSQAVRDRLVSAMPKPVPTRVGG
jgi:hypothetical protein